MKRLAYTVILIFFVIILNWIIFEAMPGLTGNLYAVLGQQRLPPNIYANQIKLYGLDQPYWVKFYDYIRAMLTFNFGFSYQDNTAVSADIIQSGRLFNTLELLGTSTLISIVIGVVLGIVASDKRGSAIDTASVSASLATFALPTFFIGIILIFLFADVVNWFPSGNTVPYSWQTVGAVLPSLPVQILTRLQFLFLPALTLTLFGYGGFVLLTRATMTESLSEDYILTARAKGLPRRVILTHHAFKNASLPIITSSALSFGTILGGAIITETIFNWNGLGYWLYDAVLYKDFPVMQAMFYIIALCVIAANLISDIMYGMVDPRIKYE